MTFLIGERVVCVDASKGPWADIQPLVLGGMYVIDRLYHSPVHGLGVQLRDRPVPNPTDWYYARRFRPLIERKTDSGVAILKKIARDVTERKKITERA
jgi:hypothetical protein